MGKLLREARWEVALCADILDYYADNADVFLAPEKLLVKGGEAKAPHGLALAHEPMDRLYRHL
jgi:succinate-semialdehyde dehydrogenase / glutarate-semialdehyde dehydrogenase